MPTFLLLLLAPSVVAAVRTIPVVGEVPALTVTVPAVALPGAPAGLGAATPVFPYGATQAGLMPAALTPAWPLPTAIVPAAYAPAIKTGLLPQALASREDLVRSAVAAPTTLGALESLDTVYFGGRRKGKGDGAEGPIVNDDGVPLFGRAAEYYKYTRRVVNRLQDRVDLSESLDVMGDTYAEVWAKLKTIEALSRGSHADEANTHLERTLTWVDGVIERAGRREAVHTHRVYFHKAKNPRSEIAEGIRRADAYLEEVLPYFAEGGKAEQAIGEVDQVTLAFDTRGYREIKSYLKRRAAEVEKATGGRVRFAFVDELAQQPSNEYAMRAELAALVARYLKQAEGLSKIVEGVTYSRYVGLVLELETIEHYLAQGYEILQSGRDIFDADGMYVTELDTVVRAPDGTVSLVEARAARVPLGVEQAAQKKVLYKLEAYQKHRALLEKEIGGPLRVVFSIDVGWNEDLADHLKGREASLSTQYGFPISFLFLESGPQLKRGKTKTGR